MKNVIIFGFLLGFLFCNIGNASKEIVPVPFYQTVDPEIQSAFDHAPENIYLYPQAFSTTGEEIAYLTLRVCTEWTEPKPYTPYLPEDRRIYEYLYSEDDYIIKWFKEQQVPFTPAKIPYLYKPGKLIEEHLRYKEFFKPSVCKRYKDVLIPTVNDMFNYVQNYSSMQNKVIIGQQLKTDLDLNEMIKAMSSSEGLAMMRKEMENTIRDQILKSPVMEEIKTQLYREIKAELEKKKREE